MVVNAMIVDRGGEWCQNASDNARVLGTGNGNPVSLEPDKATTRNAYRGLCQIILQTTEREGALTVKAESPGLVCGVFELEVTVSSGRPAIEGSRPGKTKTAESAVLDNLL